jgi:2-polyprenyl-3-methyl-5-hydroxy-6-metoxy-1,4-benzoquinol methylase
MAGQIHPLKYTFKPVTNCEMCDDKADHHKVLGQRLNKSQGLRPKSKTGISVSVKRCTNCGLIYSDPQPIPSSIQDHYGIPAESYWEEAHFHWEPSYFLKQINKAKQIIGFHQGMKALDIGSGSGKGVMSLTHAGFDAYGIEPSETFYKKSLEFRDIGPDKIKLSSVEDAVYNDNEFDFIVINAVAEHMYTPSASIANAVKWLKPCGVLYIEVPSADYFVTGLIDLYFKMIGTLYTSHISPMHEPYHLFEFSKKSFEENAKRNNYTIVDSEYFVCNIPFFPRVVHPILRKYMEMTHTGMDVEVWIKKK